MDHMGLGHLRDIGWPWHDKKAEHEKLRGVWFSTFCFTVFVCFSEHFWENATGHPEVVKHHLVLASGMIFSPQKNAKFSNYQVINYLVIQSDDPFKGLSDLQLGDEKGTLNHLVGDGFK